VETKTLVKQIKAKNRSSNRYVFVSVLSGIGTTLLTVLLVHLLFAGEITGKQIGYIGAGIAVLQITKAVFYALGLWRAHRAAYQSLLVVFVSIFIAVNIVTALIGLKILNKHFRKAGLIK
jgi:ATP-binding cassette subfamily B protein